MGLPHVLESRKQMFIHNRAVTKQSLFLFCFIFCSTGAWTQGLHREPLHQPFFETRLFGDRVSWTICPGWFQATILLISASWVARITGVSQWAPGWQSSFKRNSLSVVRMNGRGQCFFAPSFVSASFLSHSWLLLNPTGLKWGWLEIQKRPG
jgi:hypothetical protein